MLISRSSYHLQSGIEGSSLVVEEVERLVSEALVAIRSSWLNYP
jgi:hypothetical protein